MTPASHNNMMTPTQAHNPAYPTESIETVVRQSRRQEMSIQSQIEMEDVSDVLAVMRQQEVTTYRRNDYLASGEFDEICDSAWRQRLCEWMFGLVDHCSLRRDSVAIAVYYMDRCVENRSIESRQEFQLAAMTALQLAIKLYDSTVIKLDSMVKLGRGLFKAEDVVVMEKKMLDALKWQVHPPTAVCFVRQYLRLIDDSVAPLVRYILAEVSIFICEVAVCLASFIKYPPSLVAYASMLITMERIDATSLPIWQRHAIFRTMVDMVQWEVTSPEVVEVVTLLSSSLAKNVNLQDLMNAITHQCQQGYYKLRCNEHAPIEKGCSQSSPRDVVQRHI